MIKEKLKSIAFLRSEINDYFDNMVSEHLVDMTDEYWTIFGEYKPNSSSLPESATRAGEVGWSEESPTNCDDREHIYQESVRVVVRKDAYTLVCIHTSTGDGCEDLVFDNTKEITETELNS